MEKVKVGIIGAAGYTAGELMRILVNHPEAKLVSVQSESNAGNPVHRVHTDLIGDIELDFEPDFSQDVDVLFLCKGHGESKKFIENNSISENIKIVDLSHDYRLEAEGNDFVYGLPEINRDGIRAARKIANPGCFATAIQLGLLPAAQSGFIDSDVHISGITGSTGAGQSLSPTSHFSWRNNNMSVYKAFTHQHLGEIAQSLRQVREVFRERLNFIPYRGNFTRGIIITSYFYSKVSQQDLIKAFSSFYTGQVFTHVIDKNPDVKQVVNTNKCLVYPQKVDEDRVMVISIIDNLLKGAAGQAVQNMNLMFGLDEKAGLSLKASLF